MAWKLENYVILLRGLQLSPGNDEKKILDIIKGHYLDQQMIVSL